MPPFDLDYQFSYVWNAAQDRQFNDAGARVVDDRTEGARPPERAAAKDAPRVDGRASACRRSDDDAAFPGVAQ
jgi:hypothetical protein